MPEQMAKQDAIETLENFRNDYTREDSAICRAIDIAIGALRQHTIEAEESTIESEVRLIDANALKAKLKIGTNTATYSDYCNGYCDARQVDLDTIDAAPTIEPEVRNGWWILIGRSRITKSRDLKCSVCGNYFRVYDDVTLNAGRGDANFCPNCGAYMREDGGADNEHQV